ncbi:uncharacterized protein LOC109704650 isoform X2 [Ananas comosus]|uniref:Uncharacterized protein LOC109704650 isoform X2 n=1 Tax=Ananas comosus TaxID=4615 RepID=A0A6P5EHH6_ANACO|nr:uncharacterized protein LOC109704650 isoform X2 [Ananas comosus]
MDKSWISKPRNDNAYIDGVRNFIKFAMEKSSINGKILCPCRKCYNNSSFVPEVVEEHLVWNGFLLGYNVWVFHGESFVTSSSEIECTSFALGSTSAQESSSRQDGLGGLLQDVFGIMGTNLNNEQVMNETIPNNLEEYNDEAYATGFLGEQNFNERSMQSSPSETIRYKNLVKDCDQELYPGCKTFSKISFILRLFHLKCLNGWSGKSFTMLLQLLKDSFPEGTSLPSSYYEAKKLIKDLGLGYEKIHVCPNDCMLYWGETMDQEYCNVCGSSRWTMNKDDDDGSDDLRRKKKPAKILRYFPLIPRLKRIYMSSKVASLMRWHDEGRIKDGILRHPADGLAWKSFDDHYLDFSSDPRSVRLGLASDGFNPFRTMSTTYSTWPVILIPYNLPPWLCMKQSSLILSMVIPGEKGPGNDIDIYLQPLIAELKQLWDGVDTFDASTKQNFIMKGALMWTVNDFPAYANLSGWSTKGRVACPCCGVSTDSRWLKHSKKFCYMGHRRWLEPNHSFRYQQNQFDGTIELRSAPISPSGIDVLRQLEGTSYKYGKGSKSSKKRMREEVASSANQVVDEVGTTNQVRVFEDADEFIGDDHDFHEVGNDSDTLDASTQCVVKNLWKKKSIFFELPYWKYNLLRHNLDVMHIQKNVCDNFIGTFLNMHGRTKDNLNARKDLEDMGIRHDLHPKLQSNNKTYIPHAIYTMSTQDKVNFLTVLKNIKVPDGYASNISRCVNLKERTLSNLKSHDGHILLQDILPLALRASMSKQIITIISELSLFFKSICSKSLDPKALDQLDSSVALTLCHIEKIFPPSFFTIMVHLIIHLASEAKLGGPVHYRWMYPIERYLVRLKSYVRNRAKPEGSIAEGYIAEECLTFCSRYLEGVETIFNRPQRNYDDVDNAEAYMFLSGGRVLGNFESIVLDEISLAQAHRYVLLHCDKITSYQNFWWLNGELIVRFELIKVLNKSGW